MSGLKILAIVTVRNEALHVARCLADFCRQGIEVVLIDNQSTDGTVELARPFRGLGLREILTLPWTGAFSLSDQLAMKAAVVAGTDADWIIHADADEWMVPPSERGPLATAIAAVDAAGYSCINFNEFVFIPRGEEDFVGTDYAAMMRHYYFFAPNHPRLMRIWKRGTGGDNQMSGGHRLAAEGLRLYPVDFHLRHYIMLSAAHGRAKYGDRVFAAADLAKNWHGTRLTIRADRLVVPASPAIKALPFAASNAFDTGTPVRRHFWEWDDLETKA